jgi:hypothetical protein
MAQTKKFEDFSIGASGGYTNYETFTPEVFGQIRTALFQCPFEPKAGISYRTFDAEFRGVDQLETKSIGLFAEATIFPFQKYFFTGVRWDLITFNWFTNSSLKKLDSDLSSIIFSGTSFYGIAGIDIPVFKKIRFRLYGMPEFQEYKVSDGNFSSGNYVSDGTIQESYTKFVYQVNLGLVIRLFDKK